MVLTNQCFFVYFEYGKNIFILYYFDVIPEQHLDPTRLPYGSHLVEKILTYHMGAYSREY